MWLTAAGGALVLSAAVSYALSRYRGRRAILDPINGRSLHVVPVPRMGGTGILLGIVLAAGLVLVQGTGDAPLLSLALITISFLLVVAVSLLDDVRGVGVIARLAGHLSAAALVVAAGLILNRVSIGHDWVSLGVVAGSVVAVLLIVWLTNLYNFMDGMDGLAAGMGVFGFGAFAGLGLLAGNNGFALFNAGIAASCCGFLLSNFPPAKIFMGDTGSASLGFLAAVMMLWANHQGLFPVWIGILVFSPFIVDATWTLARRVLRGRKPWQAHREHFYQRLVLGGWSQRKVLGGEYVLMAICALFAIALESSDTVAVRCALLGALTALYLGLIRLMNLLEAGCNGRRAA